MTQELMQTQGALRYGTAGAQISTEPIALTPEAMDDIFLAFVEFTDASLETERAYRTNLRQFLRYLWGRGITKPDYRDVIAYRNHLQAEGYRASTVQNYIESLRLFFSWTEQARLYPNIAKHVKGAKVSKEHKKDYLTGGQIKAVLDGIDRSTGQGLRDYAIVLLAATGGLRVIEMHRANIEDLSTLGGHPVLYVQGKGREDKAEYIKLPAPTERALRDYLKTRGDTEAEAPLFTSMSNNSTHSRLSTRSISGTIKKHMQAAGYNSDRLTAHSLRHSAVTLSLLAGNTLQETQQFARHANIATTQIYAHNLDRIASECEQSIADSIFS